MASRLTSIVGCFFCLVSLVSASTAFACSVARGYRIMDPTTVRGLNWQTDPTLAKPAAIELRLVRAGESEGNGQSSCFDLARLELVFADGLPSDVAGVSVHSPGGQLSEFLPSLNLEPVLSFSGEQYLGFVWIDLPRRPIGEAIEVRYLTRSGKITPALILPLLEQ